MEKDAGVKIKALKVDGGAAVNNFICQFQSDILGTEVVRPKIIEMTSLGTAYLAGLAVGYWKDATEIKRCWKKDRVFKPRMPWSEANRLYQGWLLAVKRTLS
jgi:glycerol kinase